MLRLAWIRLLAVLTAACTVWLLVSCQRSSSPSEYKIGAVLALTQRGGTYGQRALKGMQLAVDELNATESFRKRPVKLIVEDSQSAAPQALSAFRKLIDVDHVPVAIGFVLSDEVLTCAPVANERKVVLLTTAAGSDKIRDAGDYIFRNRESGGVEADAIATACLDRFKIKEIAILHSTAANGVSYADAFKKAVEHLAGTIVANVGYNEGKTDYRAEIEQLRAKSPKAVYLAGLDNELGLILKQAKELGFTPQFFSTAGAISQKLLEIAGDGAEGLVCGSAPFNADSEDPRVRKFVSGFTTRFKVTPDWIAANSYDAVYMLAGLLRKGETDSEAIKLGLYAIKEFPGVGGKTAFDKDGEVTKPISLVQVRNSRFMSLGEN